MKARAFTLLETVLVLAITIMVLGIGEFTLTGYEDHLRFVRTTDQVMDAINNTVRKVMITGKAGEIRNYFNDGKVKITQGDDVQYINLPKGMKVGILTQDTNIMIHQDGHFDKACTIEFKYRGQCEKKYTFGMAFGTAEEK